MSDDVIKQIVAKKDQAEGELATLKVKVAELETEVSALEDLVKEGGKKEEATKKTRELNERITQSTLKVDGVQVSRELAADALKKGNREIAKQVAVLLTRRKTCVKHLLDLGSRIEIVEKQLREST